jgi:hypothetical protein
MSKFKFDKARADSLYTINSDGLLESHKKELSQTLMMQNQNNMAGQAPAIHGISKIYSKHIKELAKIKAEAIVESIVTGDKSIDEIRKIATGELNRFIVGRYQNKQADISQQLSILSLGPSATRSIMNQMQGEKSSTQRFCQAIIDVRLATLKENTNKDASDNEAIQKSGGFKRVSKWAIFGAIAVVFGLIADSLNIYEFISPGEQATGKAFVDTVQNNILIPRITEIPKSDIKQDSNIIFINLEPFKARDYFNSDLLVSAQSRSTAENSKILLRLYKKGADTIDTTIETGQSIIFHEYEVTFLENKKNILNYFPRFKIERSN